MGPFLNLLLFYHLCKDITASPSLSISWSLPKFMSIESMMASNHLIYCTLFSSCPQSFPASGSFPMSRLFPSGSQSIGASASASVLPMNIQDSFPLGLIGLISLVSKGLSRVFSSTTIQKHQSSTLSLIHGPTLTFVHDYWKSHSFPSKEQVSFNFMAAVSICSDFGGLGLIRCEE